MIKLKNYNSVSPHSNDKKYSENSSAEPKRMMSSLALQMTAKNSSNNVSSFNNSNLASVNYIITPNSGSISSNVLQNGNFSRQPNMIKIIGGGNESNNNNFFLFNNNFFL